MNSLFRVSDPVAAGGRGSGDRGLTRNPHRNHKAETVRQTAKNLARGDLPEQTHRDRVADHRLQRKIAAPQAADPARVQRRFDRTRGKDLGDRALVKESYHDRNPHEIDTKNH